MRDVVILRVVAKFLIPVIMLFALYVQFHGELGPGGAFQAGVILASAFILHMLVFGLETTRRVVPVAWLRIGAALGALLYGGVGVAALLRGGNYLDYDALAADPVAGQHVGIILIELGVGLTVASTMVLLIFTFAERTRR
jgi:multicomponent Na+:H+ antiporter subunit B